MKHIAKLSFALLLALPLMAGCGSKEYKETRTEEEVINELGQQALSEIGVTLSKFSSDGVALGETELVTSVNQKIYEKDEVGLDYTVKYSLSVFDGEQYKKDYLVLNEAGDKLIADMVLASELDPETCPMGSSLGGAAYKVSAALTFKGYGEGFKAPKGLTVTESFVNKEIVKKSYNAVVKTVKSGSLHEIKATAQAKEMVYFIGRVSAWFEYSSSQLYSGLFITDGAEGIMLYAGCITTAFFDGDTKLINEGDIISAYGEVSPYNGLFEVKPQKITLITDEVEKAKVAPTQFSELTVEQVNASKQEDTGKLVTVSGLKVKSFNKDGSTDPSVLSVGSHWSITVEDSSGNSTLLYVNYHIGEAAQTAIKDFLTNLGTKSFSFRGALSSYNGCQLSPVNTADFTAAEGFSADK